MFTKYAVFSISFLSLLLAKWEPIKSNDSVPAKISLLNSDIFNSTIKFEIDGFELIDVNTENGPQSVVKIDAGASIMELGSPDLQKLSASIIIPDDKKMNFRILETEFVEFNNILIAPSKGNLTRNSIPSEIEYEWNDTYTQNLYYPGRLAKLNTPYIVRDNRGITVNVFPFQYNPISKTLKVYTQIIVEIFEEGPGIENIKNRQMNRTSDFKISNEFDKIYNDHFLNTRNDTRFDYLSDEGNMLIISSALFMDEMQAFVDWKNKIGIKTEIVNVSSIGVNSNSISSYVENYYYNQGLTYLLLVGDIAQMPSPSLGGSASDPSYGFIEGNDQYPEIIVGRFSGQNPAQIQTQVQRSIEYERFPETNASWYDNALGIASQEGPGFNGYSDDVFNEFLWNTVLSNYTYDSYQGVYDGSGGSDAMGINAINSGVGLINYTGHGSISSWGNGASLSGTQINSLTNQNMLPFVITVGCNVGEFNNTDECFAESWQRATHNGEPSGGIAHFGSTIPQSWEPPMHGQYGMNLIITETFNQGTSRSLGGITTNGVMYMNDAQGSAGMNETNYWTFFGDPSIVIRTDQPSSFSPNHDEVIIIGQEEFIVDIGFNGALAALSRDGELIGSAYSEGGIAIIPLGNNASNPGEFDLVVTAFNKFPYESVVTVLTPNGAYVTVNDINLDYGNDSVITPGENININVTLENLGNESSDEVSVTVFEVIDNPYISILDGFESVDNLANGSMSSLEFSVNVSSATPMGHTFALQIELSSPQNTSSTTLNLSVQAMVESFENSGFSNQNWIFDGASEWYIDSSNSSNGLFSARSGALPNAEVGSVITSELSLSLEVLQEGYIRFDKKVSCEDVGSSSGNYYDYLAFYINDVEQSKWAGEVAWSQSEFFVEEGQNVFKWVFSKDQGVVSGQDAVWIDNVEFPPCADSANFIAGDTNYDGQINVLDIVLVVNMILDITPDDLTSADINQDGQVNVIDIVNIVNLILDGRGLPASSVQLLKRDGLLSFEADGVVDAIQLNILHNENVKIDLTENSLISKMSTFGNKSTVIIVAPETNDILSFSNDIEILNSTFANSMGEIDQIINSDFNLINAYPNPFNPTTKLTFDIPIDNDLIISIYDLNGRIITTLHDSYITKGIHSIYWNAGDLSSGIYFAKFSYNDKIKTQKLILIK